MFSIFKKPKVEQPPAVILPEVNGIQYTERDRAALARHTERIQRQQAAKADAPKITHDLHESNRKYVQSKNKKPWT